MEGSSNEKPKANEKTKRMRLKRYFDSGLEPVHSLLRVRGFSPKEKNKRALACHHV